MESERTITSSDGSICSEQRFHLLCFESASISNVNCAASSFAHTFLKLQEEMSLEGEASKYLAHIGCSGPSRSNNNRENCE